MKTFVEFIMKIIYVLILSLWLSGLAVAEEPRLSVDPVDQSLIIRGTLDNQTTTFSRNVRLTVTDGKAETLLLLPSDLRHTTEPNVIIDRGQITIPAGIRLNDGQPYDVRVTVSNVQRPGTYKGELKFLLPGQSEANALTIPLTMHIDAQPDVVPVAANMTFQVARCQNLPDCILATWFLPDSVVRNDWLVQLDNRTLRPVEITASTVVMQGEKTGNALSPSEVSLTVPHTLPANQVEPIDVTIHRNKLSPDHYSGTFRFNLKGADTPVSVNVVLDVRSGPLLPLLIVILGIMVGRLARSMETPAAQVQVKLYPRYARLKADATSVKNEEASAYLEKQLNTFKQNLDSGKETEEVLTRDLNKLEAQINFLNSLEMLEQQLKTLGLDALTENLQDDFINARNALLEDNIKQAEQLRRQIEERLHQAQADGTMGKATDFFTTLLNTFRTSSTQLVTEQERPAPTRVGGKRWNWLARLLAVLAGAQSISSEVRFWLFRPLLFFILLIVLALLGLQTLYVNAGATFGVSGLYDYLGLFLWGLTAEVAQRTLQSLGKPQ